MTSSSTTHSTSSGAYDDHSYSLDDQNRGPNQPLFIEVPSSGSLSDNGGYTVMINDSMLASSAEHSDEERDISTVSQSTNIYPELRQDDLEDFMINKDERILEGDRRLFEIPPQDQNDNNIKEPLETVPEEQNETSVEQAELLQEQKNEITPVGDLQEARDKLPELPVGDDDKSTVGETKRIESVKNEESFSFEISDTGVSRSSSIRTVATNVLVNKSCNEDDREAHSPQPSTPKTPTSEKNKGFSRGSDISISSPIEGPQSPLPPRSPEKAKRPSVSLAIEDSVRLLQEEFKAPELPTIYTSSPALQLNQGTFELPSPPQRAWNSPPCSPRDSQDRTQMEETDLLSYMKDNQFLWSGLFKVDSMSSNSDESSVPSVIQEEHESIHPGSDVSSVASSRRSLIGTGYGTIGKQQIVPMSYNSQTNEPKTKVYEDNNNSTTNLLSKENLYSHGKKTVYDEEKLLDAVNNIEFNNLYLPIQYADIFSMTSSQHGGAEAFTEVYSMWRLIIFLIICLFVPPLFFWVAFGKSCGVSDFRLMKMVMSRRNRNFLYQGFIWDVDMTWLRLTCLLFGILELLAACAGIAVGLGVGLTR